VSGHLDPIELAGPQVESAVVEPPPTPGGRRVLDERGRVLLRAVLNRLVPARAELPGAGDLDVGDSVQDALAVSPRLRRLFLDGLSEMEIAAYRRFGRSFGGLEAAEQIHLLQEQETASPAFFEALVEHAYRGYYTLPTVRRAIGAAGRPPQPFGFELPPFDPALLNRQRLRAPFWRQT
jgi:hypothetical protein